MNNNENECVNKARVWFAVIYLLIPIITIIIRNKAIFYINYDSDSYNIDRFLWCLSSSLFGFSIVAFQLIHNSTNPFPKYITYYPFILLMMASLVFSVLHIFNQTSGFVFYYMSFCLCFILSFLVDNFFGLFKGLIEKSIGKK